MSESVALDIHLKRSPVEAIGDYYTFKMAKINQVILDKMKSPVESIPKIANHLVSLSGKRLRPLILLAAADMCNYAGDKDILLAAAIEFMHTATLLHDDVVDKSTMRRGKPTVNFIWGNKSSVLVGDFLLSKAFDLIVTVGDTKTMSVLSNSVSTLVEGEMLQMLVDGDLTITREMCIDIIFSKTAALFSTAAKIGAGLSGNSKQIEGLSNYARNLGIAFQIVDDILDYNAEEKVLGKKIGDDFKDRRITLPVVIAYEEAEEKEKEFWQRVFSDDGQEMGDFEMALDYLNKGGALSEARRMAEEYVWYAQQSLSIFPDSIQKEMLLNLAQFVLKRDH